MSHPDATRALVSLGFSRVEAEVYVFLVEHAPATGYGIAKGLGKAAAGVYKVLDSLIAKGAVTVDDGGVRLHRAAPHGELLQRLRRQFDEQQQLAEQALSSLRTAERDDRVYRLAELEAVLGRFAQMMARAERIALVDVFPELLPRVRDDLEGAAARGVQVVVQLYRPAELEVSRTVLVPSGESVLARWRASWLNAVIDSSEVLLSMVSSEEDKVYQAIWSTSPFLSLVQHGGQVAELMVHAVNTAIATEGPEAVPSVLAALHAQLRFTPSDLPGLAEIASALTEGSLDEDDT